MSALCFCVFSVFADIHKASCSLIRNQEGSGISVKTVLREREKYLFERYCREVNEEFAVMENQSKSKPKSSSSANVPSSRRQVTDLDIEFPEEAEESLLSVKSSRTQPQSSSEEFLTFERTDISQNVSSVSGKYWTANEDSNHTMVPSVNMRTDSAPSSHLDDLTLRSLTTESSRDSFVIPMVEEYTGREENWTVTVSFLLLILHFSLLPR